MKKPKYNSISEWRAFEILEDNKDDLDLYALGFVTTVLRDNELNEQLHDYYNAVLKLIFKLIDDDKE